MTESQHLLLLATAVIVSVVVSALRSWRAKRWWPLAFALSGAALIVTGHAVPSVHELEWAGVLVLLVGGLREHLAWGARRGVRRANDERSLATFLHLKPLRSGPRWIRNTATAKNTTDQTCN